MGKHRKPTNNGKRAAVILTGVAITAPLPMVANAAEESTWDALADCESSGNWSADTGNGYSGGLQFSPSTWKAFGGTGNAADASRETQIAVAERVLDEQGWNAWPSCSKKIGASGAADTSTPVPSTTMRANEKLKTAKPKVASSDSADSYTVKPGDWLSKIAKSNDTTVSQLASDNGIANVNRIYPGQVLTLDGKGTTTPSVPNSNTIDTAKITPTAPAKYTTVISAAKQYLGTPYLYGGTGRNGIDCSALVQNAFAKVGKSVPRTSAAQYVASTRISKSELRPGDLAFIRNNGKVSHVVMYIGDGKIIESSRPGQPVAIRSLYSQLNAFGRI